MMSDRARTAIEARLREARAEVEKLERRLKKAQADRAALCQKLSAGTRMTTRQIGAIAGLSSPGVCHARDRAAAAQRAEQ